MPMYQYVCDDCGFEFERVQSFHDEPLSTCPECEGTVRRVITSVGIIFKGSGWYITDSRRQISSTAGSGDRAKPAADKASDDAKPAADAQPAAAEPKATTTDQKTSQPKKEAAPAS
jgi:putative FmdB family regulatory protein